MSRRDFLQAVPGLAALPLVGRLFREQSVENVAISLAQWHRFRETFVGDEPLYNPPVADTSKMVKDAWLDEDNHMVVETWDGEITTKRLVRTEHTLSIETFRLNDAGEWEQIT